MGIEQYKSMPVDPRIVERISKDSKMSAEQGNFLSRWGGPEMYKTLASMTESQRMTFAAVANGYTSAQEISEVTGFTPWEVNRALTSLGNRGLITDYKNIMQEVPYPEPKIPETIQPVVIDE